MRNSVATFKNTTGYVKRPIYKATSLQQTKSENAKQEVEKVEIVDNSEVANVTKTVDVEKTVISEADSTDSQKKTIKADVLKVK